MPLVFVNLSLMILVPVLPAYLLFKALPSNANVSGPLQGLQVKLGGAFAGYFALLVLVLSTHSIWNPPPSYQVWDVEGRIVDTQGLGLQPLDIKNFELAPDTFRASSDGGFKLSFYTLPGQSGEVRFPGLTFTYPEYEPRTITLDPADPEFAKQSKADRHDLERHVIKLQPIKIKRLPPYSATAQDRTPAIGVQEHVHENP